MYPTSLGVDKMGQLFIYDSGNNYIRMLDNKGVMHTLIKGACRQDLRLPIINYT